MQQIGGLAQEREAHEPLRLAAHQGGDHIFPCSGAAAEAAGVFAAIIVHHHGSLRRGLDIDRRGQHHAVGGADMDLPQGVRDGIDVVVGGPVIIHSFRQRRAVPVAFRGLLVIGFPGLRVDDARIARVRRQGGEGQHEQRQQSQRQADDPVFHAACSFPCWSCASCFRRGMTSPALRATSPEGEAKRPPQPPLQGRGTAGRQAGGGEVISPGCYSA